MCQQGQRGELRQVGDKLSNLGFAHLTGMALIVEKDEAPNPVYVRLFRADTEVLDTQHHTHLVKQLGFSEGG